MVWYSHLFQNFPQFIVIHTVRGFGIVNKAEIDLFFWNSLAFLMIQWMLAIYSLNLCTQQLEVENKRALQVCTKELLRLLEGLRWKTPLKRWQVVCT